jgi:flagellar biogenesis protein FliO
MEKKAMGAVIAMIVGTLLVYVGVIVFIGWVVIKVMQYFGVI